MLVKANQLIRKNHKGLMADFSQYVEPTTIKNEMDRFALEIKNKKMLYGSLDGP